MAVSSSFLSTASLPNSKSTFAFAFSVSPAPITSLSRVVFRSSIPASSHRRVMTVRSKIREIFMPALSSTMTEGKIVTWIKTEGEKLAKGESVVVVESDEVDMDVETFYDGYLAAIVVGEGESAPVGAAIGLLAETEAEIEVAKTKAASKSSSSAPPPAAEAVVPSSPPVTSSPAPAMFISGPFLEEISRSLELDDEAKPVNRSSNSVASQKSYVKKCVMENVDPNTSQKHQEVVPMVGLDAMKRANTTLDDFVSVNRTNFSCP